MVSEMGYSLIGLDAADHIFHMLMNDSVLDREDYFRNHLISRTKKIT